MSTRTHRIFAGFLGLVTLLPWLGLGLLIAYVVPRLQLQDRGVPPDMTAWDTTVVPLIFVGGAIDVALVGAYLIHLVRSDRVPSAKKQLWAAVLLAMQFLGMPVYWYLYVWPRHEHGAA